MDLHSAGIETLHRCHGNQRPSFAAHLLSSRSVFFLLFFFLSVFFFGGGVCSSKSEEKTV